ncbi:hypothetical protein EDB86DRAFT_2812530 [Lactarius hatsudake]|nr:hypothetical protein EDB86DRAFT_2812530 [Lactarius hatsudake]
MKELPREANARSSHSDGTGKKAKTVVKPKTFNMTTIKIHCIPDYPAAIQRYGTTDSYSTQTSSLDEETSYLHSHSEDEDTLTSDPKGRYWMPKSKASSKNLTQWLSDSQEDHALRDFRRRLHDHLLARIEGRPYTSDEHNFTDLDRDRIVIDQNRIYEHKIIQFMSTTYDARRMDESANPRTHADVIVLSHEEGHQAFPYWHARIIGIYHVMVQLKVQGGLTDPRRMDVLFVRWFGLDSVEGRSGWRARRMHSVGFLPDTDVLGPAFGFLDPSEVIRMVHLIPDFVSGRTKELLIGPSMALRTCHPDGEYKQYYVAM